MVESLATVIIAEAAEVESLETVGIIITEEVVVEFLEIAVVEEAEGGFLETVGIITMEEVVESLGIVGVIIMEVVVVESLEIAVVEEMEVGFLEEEETAQVLITNTSLVLVTAPLEKTTKKTRTFRILTTFQRTQSNASNGARTKTREYS